MKKITMATVGYLVKLTIKCKLYLETTVKKNIMWTAVDRCLQWEITTQSGQQLSLDSLSL